MGWGINKYAEGDDKAMSPESQEEKRQALAAGEWARGKILGGVKKAQLAHKTKTREPVGAYIGIAAAIRILVTTALEQAAQDTQAEFGKVTDEHVRAMQIEALAYVLREIVEGKDEIERM